MNSLASPPDAAPLDAVAVIAAVGWPFAVALVALSWSRLRGRRTPEAQGERRASFRTIDGRAVPERLASVIEALEEAQARRAPPRRRGEKRDETPAAAT